MQLHCPAALGIAAAQVQQKRRLVAQRLFRGEGHAVQPAEQRVVDLVARQRRVHRVGQAVVGKAAAVRVEELHASVQRGQQRVKVLDDDAGGFAQFFNVVGKGALFDVHGLVGPPCGQHLDREGSIGSQFFVPDQAVRRVVRGADELDVAVFDQLARAHFRILQFFAGQIPDLLRGIRPQHALPAEEALQFQMAPMIERIADGAGEHLGVFLEFFAVGRVAGDVFFLHASRAHQAPFVVVAAQPRLRQVLKAAVFIDFLRAQMAVVVDDGHLRCVIEEQLARRRRFEQKVFIHKSSHGSSPPHVSGQWIRAPPARRKTPCAWGWIFRPVLPSRW